MRVELLMVVVVVQAATSAKVLLDTGDMDGACNRAYYAMFDAACAALLAISQTLRRLERFGELVGWSASW